MIVSAGARAVVFGALWVNILYSVVYLPHLRHPIVLCVGTLRGDREGG